MSVRRSLFDHIQFDERLKSHSWLEDADIGKRRTVMGQLASVPTRAWCILVVDAGATPRANLVSRRL